MGPQAQGHMAMLAFSALVAGSFSLGSLVANDIAPAAMAFVITAVISRLSQYTVLGIDESEVSSLLPDIARILVSGSGSFPATD